MKDQGRESPLEMMWRPRSILWMVASGEGLALLLALSPAADQVSRGAYFAFLSFFVQWVLLTTLSLLYVLRRAIHALSPLQIGNVVIVLLVACAMVTNVIIGLAYGSLLDERTGAYFDLRLATSIAITSGVIGLAVFHAHWRSRQMAIRAKQAELDALRARVNPHFLFNTLNTATALLHAQPAKAESLLLDLSDLFRAALSDRESIPLEEELEFAKRYLDIELLRFDDRLRVRWQLPSVLPDVPLPSLALQTLVENAVHHGAEPGAAPTTVVISVLSKPGTVHVIVSNRLPSRDRDAEQGHRIGLASTRARVEALTQGEGRLQTRVEDGEFVAEIILPAGPARST